MGWSTRQIADLAGTTLKTVRHYHEVGLLDEPARTRNGYKQYGVEHLVRLMQIKRMTDLGFSLSDIAAVQQHDGHPEQALRTLDSELAATIERLQRARVEIAVILRDSLPIDLPSEFADAAAALSPADRNFVTFATTILSPSALDAYGRLVRDAPTMPTDSEFDTLAADADDNTRADLAARMAPQVGELAARYPELFDTSDGDVRRKSRAFDVAVEDLYNEAQHDVIRRIATILAPKTE